jgi:hypothetical protein
LGKKEELINSEDKEEKEESDQQREKKLP